MTDHPISVTEDELHAYVDGELPAERRSDVEAWLIAHPADAERVRAWRAMAEALHARYDRVANEPVPRRLELERLGRGPRRWVIGSVAAALIAFTCGGAIGWIARGEVNSPLPTVAEDALDAHRLYVVEVRHPVEVPGSERAHLQQWLTKRCGWDVRAPDLGSTGLKLVGGRLLPGPNGPASFLMYEGPAGERFTIYAAKAPTEAAQMRFTALDKDGAMFWADRGVGYVVSGSNDRARLAEVARAVYEQVDRSGG